MIRYRYARPWHYPMSWVRRAIIWSLWNTGDLLAKFSHWLEKKGL